MRIVDHRLHLADGQPARFLKSPNQSDGLQPKYLVVHYTAGPNAKRAIETLLSPARKASAHLVIGRDGEVTQLVEFNKRAWHAGLSSWKGLKGLNAHSIGIELSNPGKLKKTSTGWKTWFDAKVDPEHVLEAVHRNGGGLSGWHTYTAEQLDALTQVAEVLFSTYGLEDVLGHEDIAPGRKTDPGPAFPMAQFKAALVGRHQEDEEAPYDDTELFVVREPVNIRTEPSTAGAKLTSAPLPKGTRVAVIDQSGIWRRVDVLDDPEGEDPDLEGWIHGRFLARG